MIFLNVSALVGDKDYTDQNFVDLSGWHRLVLRYAWVVAQILHLGQFRRTGDRYIKHPQAVANLCRIMGLSTSAQAAALLHDVVEENHGWKRIVAISLILLSGPVIASMVFVLTKWRGTDEEYLLQILRWSWLFRELPAVKLADKFTCVATPMVRSREKEIQFLETLMPDGCFARFVDSGRQKIPKRVIETYSSRFKVIQSIAEQRLGELAKK